MTKYATKFPEHSSDCSNLMFSNTDGEAYMSTCFRRFYLTTFRLSCIIGKDRELFCSKIV